LRLATPLCEALFILPNKAAAQLQAREGHPAVPRALATVLEHSISRVALEALAMVPCLVLVIKARERSVGVGVGLVEPRGEERSVLVVAQPPCRSCTWRGDKGRILTGNGGQIEGVLGEVAGYHETRLCIYMCSAECQ